MKGIGTAVEKRIREHSIQKFWERWYRMGLEKETDKLLYLLDMIPSEKNRASFDLSTEDGSVEGFNLKELPNFAIDILKIKRNSKTKKTSLNRSILFKPVSGNCVLEYENGNGKAEKILSRSQPHEIKPGVEWILCTSKLGCELVLILGEQK